MRLSDLLFRAWYYFRIGYGTYLTFLVSGVSLVVTVYYLAIRNIPMLETVFQSFTIFTVTAVVVGAPLSVLIGWIHLKRSAAWKAELDIGAEANPYNFKLPPGYWIEVFTPLYLELLTLTSRLAQREGLLTDEERKKITYLEERLETLLRGGYVGRPRRGL